MLLKVCGMRELSNIEALDQLKPDFMGLIFYPKSKRYAGGGDAAAIVKSSGKLSRVGVFVNASIDEVIEKVNLFQLTYAQLHGDESVEYVQQVRSHGIKVIKVFRIDDEFPEEIERFSGLVDYFLFDTATQQYGGSGKQFDWI